MGCSHCPYVIGEDELPLGAKYNLIPLWDAAINPNHIGEDQLHLANKCTLSPVWDVAINLSVIGGR